MLELDQDGHTTYTIGNIICIACKAEYISTSQIPCTRTSVDTKVSVGTTVELERFPVSRLCVDYRSVQLLTATKMCYVNG